MPLKLTRSLPLDNAEARIEIIPLIDIMFFLLAAFMLVSLSLVNSRSVNVNLPAAATATWENQKGWVTLAVDQAGLVFLDQRALGRHELAAELAARRRTNAALRVLIRGDREARHGDIIRVLDLVRGTGIDKVAFDIRPSPRP